MAGRRKLPGCSPTNCNVLGPFGGGYWSAFGLGAADYNNWWVQLVCVTGNCYGSPQAGAFVRDVTMVMSDDSAPNVTQAGSCLTAKSSEAPAESMFNPAMSARASSPIGCS